MYHYAGNNPIRYIDPDGEKITKLTDSQWTIVKRNLDNLSLNLGSLINQLDECNNDITKLDPKILEAAKTYLTSEFGEFPMDIAMLKSIITNIKEHVDSLDRKDFKYDDSTKAYAYTFPLLNNIYLGDNFFDSQDSGGYDTKEGTLLHEVTHYFLVLWTSDPTYSDEEMKKLPDRTKQKNANNWEYFYEKIFNE